MKIGLTGTHGTGKTTFMNLFLEKHPEFRKVTEIARQCPYPINEKTGFLSQEWILRKQITAELGLQFVNNVITDRTTIDQMSYISWSARHNQMKQNEEEMLLNTCLSWAGTYDLIVLFPIEFALVADGVRSTSDKYRMEIDNGIVDILAQTAFPYITVSGDNNHRLAQLERELRGMDVL